MTFPNVSALKPKASFQTSLAYPSVSMARALHGPSSFLKHLAYSSNSGLFSSLPPNYKLHVKRLRAVGRLSLSGSRFNEDWLGSLSCPFVGKDGGDVAIDGVLASANGAVSTWVVGVDPDVCGAVAVLRCDSNSVVSSQVFDNPYVQVLVGKRVRKRLDAKSIVELLRSLEAPMGTAAYIEQSTPFPKDGKQGWWSGGFGYGLWIGILVASGFSVIPVPCVLWKNHFGLCGSASSKDDSRRAASTLFPSLDTLLKRKKDHDSSGMGHSARFGASLSKIFPLSMDNGYCILNQAGADVTIRVKQPSQRGRAEALLIAAYGKGLTVQSETSST